MPLRLKKLYIFSPKFIRRHIFIVLHIFY
jgi:hypothetical protein